VSKLTKEAESINVTDFTCSDIEKHTQKSVQRIMMNMAASTYLKALKVGNVGEVACPHTRDQTILIMNSFSKNS